MRRRAKGETTRRSKGGITEALGKSEGEWNQVIFWDCADGHHSTGNNPTL